MGMERFYYVKDHLGSIRQTINEEGEIVAAQDYYAYGEIIPGRSYNAGMTDENIKFTEKERDTETNYDYFGARYYNSKLGIWLSVDPARSLLPGVSLYNYVQNNPLNRIDPNGMWDYRSNDEIFSSGQQEAGLSPYDESNDGGDDKQAKDPNSEKGRIVSVSLSSAYSFVDGLNFEMGFNYNIDNGYIQHYFGWGTSMGFMWGPSFEVSIFPNQSLNDLNGSGTKIAPKKNSTESEIGIIFGYNIVNSMENGSFQSPLGLNIGSYISVGTNIRWQTFSSESQRATEYFNNLINFNKN